MTLQNNSKNSETKRMTGCGFHVGMLTDNEIEQLSSFENVDQEKKMDQTGPNIRNLMNLDFNSHINFQRD